MATSGFHSGLPSARSLRARRLGRGRPGCDHPRLLSPLAESPCGRRSPRRRCSRAQLVCLTSGTGRFAPRDSLVPALAAAGIRRLPHLHREPVPPALDHRLNICFFALFGREHEGGRQRHLDIGKGGGWGSSPSAPTARRSPSACGPCSVSSQADPRPSSR